MSKHHRFDPTKPIVLSNPSTGPITEAGKAIASRNATQHGCCSTETLILPTESREAFFAAFPNPLDWTEEHHKKLTRFLRYQTTRTNLVTKARKAVKLYRRNRDLENACSQIINSKDEKLTIPRETLNIYKQHHPPFSQRRHAQRELHPGFTRQSDLGHLRQRRHHHSLRCRQPA